MEGEREVPAGVGCGCWEQAPKPEAEYQSKALEYYPENQSDR